MDARLARTASQCRTGTTDERGSCHSERAAGGVRPQSNAETANGVGRRCCGFCVQISGGRPTSDVLR